MRNDVFITLERGEFEKGKVFTPILKVLKFYCTCN